MADWQSLDPEAAREAEKYENPIPSRELILQHLSDRGSPASREELADEFGMATEEQLEALRRRLRAMERDGQLIYTRRGTYAPVDKLDLILGRVSGHRDGFGFLVPDDGSDDLFLSPAQMRLVFDGDRALARVAGLDRRGRREGAVVEVISRAHESIVGRYYEESGIGFVVADNPKIQQEVLVTPGRNAGAKQGQFVEVKITHWPTPRFQPQGDVVEVVGNYMAPGMEIDVALRSYDIPHVWPEAVLKEAAKLKPEVEEKDKEKRVDLRHLPFVTIDGEDARDFDDAVFCEKNGSNWRLFSGGWKLYVAIADVSNHGQTIDMRVQRAQAVGQFFRQHRDNPLREVHRVTTYLSLGVQRRIDLHIVRYVGDGDIQLPAAGKQPPVAAVFLAIHRIVKVAGVFTVDGDERQMAQIDALFFVLLFDFRLELARLFNYSFGPDVGNIVAAQSNVDFHARRHIVANHFNHIALGLEARSRPVGDFHLNELALLGAGITPWRYQHFLLNLRVISDDKTDTAFFVITADDAFVGAGDYFNHGTFTTTTTVEAGNPRQCTVAIEHQAHLRRAQEQVIAAVIWHQKAKAIAMPADTTQDQVELVDRGIGAATGIDQLTIALHSAQTTTQRFELLFSGHAKFIGQLFTARRGATVRQVLQDQLATWNGVFVFFRFTSGLGIEGLPIGH